MTPISSLPKESGPTASAPRDHRCILGSSAGRHDQPRSQQRDACNRAPNQFVPSDDFEGSVVGRDWLFFLIPTRFMGNNPNDRAVPDEVKGVSGGRTRSVREVRHVNAPYPPCPIHPFRTGHRQSDGPSRGRRAGRGPGYFPLADGGPSGYLTPPAIGLIATSYPTPFRPGGIRTMPRSRNGAVGAGSAPAVRPRPGSTIRLFSSLALSAIVALAAPSSGRGEQGEPSAQARSSTRPADTSTNSGPPRTEEVDTVALRAQTQELAQIARPGLHPRPHDDGRRRPTSRIVADRPPGKPVRIGDGQATRRTPPCAGSAGWRRTTGRRST